MWIRSLSVSLSASILLLGCAYPLSEAAIMVVTFLSPVAICTMRTLLNDDVMMVYIHHDPMVFMMNSRGMPLAVLLMRSLSSSTTL